MIKDLFDLIKRSKIQNNMLYSQTALLCSFVKLFSTMRLVYMNAVATRTLGNKRLVSVKSLTHLNAGLNPRM